MWWRWGRPADAERAVDAMARFNARILRAGDFPRLIDSGVTYVPEYERAELEELLSVPLLLEEGAADCEDLAAWRVGELLAEGVAASATVQQVSPEEWHVMVRTPWGIEDPSRDVMGW